MQLCNDAFTQLRVYAVMQLCDYRLGNYAFTKLCVYEIMYLRVLEIMCLCMHAFMQLRVYEITQA